MVYLVPHLSTTFNYWCSHLSTAANTNTTTFTSQECGAAAIRAAGASGKLSEDQNLVCAEIAERRKALATYAMHIKHGEVGENHLFLLSLSLFALNSLN